jgi:hypothetical protein
MVLSFDQLLKVSAKFDAFDGSIDAFEDKKFHPTFDDTISSNPDPDPDYNLSTNSNSNIMFSKSSSNKRRQQDLKSQKEQHQLLNFDKERREVVPIDSNNQVMVDDHDDDDDEDSSEDGARRVQPINNITASSSSAAVGRMRTGNRSESSPREDPPGTPPTTLPKQCDPPSSLVVPLPTKSPCDDLEKRHRPLGSNPRQSPNVLQSQQDPFLPMTTTTTTTASSSLSQSPLEHGDFASWKRELDAMFVDGRNKNGDVPTFRPPPVTLPMARTSSIKLAKQQQLKQQKHHHKDAGQNIHQSVQANSNTPEPKESKQKQLEEEAQDHIAARTEKNKKRKSLTLDADAVSGGTFTASSVSNTTRGGNDNNIFRNPFTSTLSLLMDFGDSWIDGHINGNTNVRSTKYNGKKSKNDHHSTAADVDGALSDQQTIVSIGDGDEDSIEQWRRSNCVTPTPCFDEGRKSVPMISEQKKGDEVLSSSTTDGNPLWNQTRPFSSGGTSGSSSELFVGLGDKINGMPIAKTIDPKKQQKNTEDLAAIKMELANLKAWVKKPLSPDEDVSSHGNNAGDTTEGSTTKNNSNEEKKQHKKKKSVQFASQLVTGTHYRPRTQPDEIDELYFNEDELDRWEWDRITTIPDRIEVTLTTNFVTNTSSKANQNDGHVVASATPTTGTSNGVTTTTVFSAGDSEGLIGHRIWHCKATSHEDLDLDEYSTVLVDDCGNGGSGGGSVRSVEPSIASF